MYDEDCEGDVGEVGEFVGGGVREVGFGTDGVDR